jgi:type IV secretory pathway VirD2 relaxase
VLYGRDGPVRAEAFEEPRPGERHQFRIIISPDDGHELDLTAYVRRVMARIERDTGRELEWAAVNHYNTDHPHTHVIVRGVDRRGGEVRFERSYISNGMRWRAQEIATEELGPRTEFQIQREHACEVTQERFTTLDRELERRMQDNRVAISSSSRPGAIRESTLVGRLEHLEGMDLAKRLSPTEWELVSGWQRTLRELAIRRDIIKQMHAAVAGDPAHYQIVAVGHPVLDLEGRVAEKPMVGRVAAKGLADELKGTFFAVVETPVGAAYRIHIGAGTAGSLRTGDIVTFGSQRVTGVLAVDRHIASVARAHEGHYELAGREDQARSVTRRLRELERSGLAVPESATQWRVVPDLLERLQKRMSAAPPRHRLAIRKQPLSLGEQVHYRGPAWLDRVQTSRLAPLGFGAEVARAIQARCEALRGFGIDPTDTTHLAKLFRLERDAVAEQFARRSRQAFVEIPPGGFRGRVHELFALGGNSYAIVSDGRSFVVVRTSQARRWDGKAITVTRDAKGMPVLREAPDRGRA